MVVDSSVIVAIMRDEADAAVWMDVLERASRAWMSVVSYVETGIVMLGRRKDLQLDSVDEVLKTVRVQVLPATLQQGSIALQAFRQFGKGRHPASLNIGDCFAYALAKSRGLPLLFKGDDFFRTDIVPAWRP